MILRANKSNDNDKKIHHPYRQIDKEMIYICKTWQKSFTDTYSNIKYFNSQNT